jgi:protease I
MTRVAIALLTLPAQDFDPTEAGVAWQALTAGGHQVRFATPDGRPAHADERMLTGRGLGPLRPLLVADARGRAAHDAMAASAAFGAPLRWDEVAPGAFDGLVLPGGHAPGMRPYLESPVLQRLVSAAFADGRPVGAICHGVLLAARARGADGRSVLHGRATTALTRRQELLAWRLTRRRLGDYYRTYPVTVQEEVTAALARPEDFRAGPLPLRRDAPGGLGRGFTVRDGAYLSARWPGDAHRFGRELAALLDGR